MVAQGRTFKRGHLGNPIYRWCGQEVRSTAIRVRLLGAYHDYELTLTYPNVHAYELTNSSVSGGHRDWRYDELRLDEKGRLIHEIEWAGPPGEPSSRWVICADDLEVETRPVGDSA